MHLLDYSASCVSRVIALTLLGLMCVKAIPAGLSVKVLGLLPLERGSTLASLQQV